MIEKSLPNNNKLTTRTNMSEVKTAKGGRRSNYVHFYKIEEHPNLEKGWGSRSNMIKVITDKVLLKLERLRSQN